MSKRFNPTKKTKVAEKCSWRCAYCGCHLDWNSLCIEHVIPKSTGGSNDIENLLPSCRSCNSTKGISDLETFRLRLAVNKRTDGILFSWEQIKFLKENNVLDFLGIELELFFFEKKGVCNGNYSSKTQ